ncbi:MAG: transcriptional regulator [Methanomassiliicoccales archaeon]
MSLVDELVSGILRGPGGFRDALKKVLEEDLEISIHEFCSRTGLSQSTVYKIMQEKREPNLRTVRMVISAVRRLENHPGGNFIAVIASRPVLNRIEERIVRIGGKDIRVKEYPATTIEEALIAAVNAERDGAVAVVCAPIVAPTVEKILSIPVSVIIPTESMLKAIEVAAERTS